MKQQLEQPARFSRLQDAALNDSQKLAVRGGYTLQPGDVVLEVLDPVTRLCRIRIGATGFVVDEILDGS